jgi:hypothetical protein
MGGVDPGVGFRRARALTTALRGGDLRFLIFRVRPSGSFFRYTRVFVEMADPEEPFDPKATMQVDAAEVADVAESQPPSQAAISRKTPPPLPSWAPKSAAPIGASQPPPRSAGQRVVFGLIVAAMLAVAAVGGWVFANSVRGRAPAASAAASSTPEPAAAAPTASASAEATAPVPTTMTLPSVEIH